MSKLREELRLQWKGIKLSKVISGKYYILCEIMSELLPQIAAYTSAYFSGRVITALSEKLPFAVPLRYALLAVSSVLVIWVIRRLFMRQTMIMRRSRYFRREAMLTGKALSLDFAQAESAEVAALLSRVEDNSDLFMGISSQAWQVSKIIANVLSVVIAVSMSSGMVMSKSEAELHGILKVVDSPVFGIMFALFVLVLIFLSIVANDAAVKRRFKAHESRGKVNALWKYYYDRVLNESGSGEDIRIYHEKPLIYEEMRERVFGAVRRIHSVFLHTDTTFGMVSTIVTAVLGGTVYLFVGLKALSGAFGAGKVVEYYAVLSQMILSFTTIAREIGLLRSNSIHLKEDISFFELESKMQNGTRTAADINTDKLEFEFHNVSFRYPETEPLVLHDFSFRIRSGERLAVVGRNGSGKSTMIKLLCRLYDPSEGYITLNGIDIREFEYSEYLKLFGIVFQDFNLLSFSIAENVACSTRYEADKVWNCLEMAGLGERVEKMPKNINQCVTKLYEEDGIDLSGGEAQKLAIARALYKDAPFVILDEPTAALDPKSESEIYARFDEMSGGRTAVYISHRMSSCRFCDRIAVFKDGTAVEEGTHEELLALGAEYSQLWNAQAQHYTDSSL
ncbi:MAG: ABC transporter ATP-binding protein [Clostridia bacterium]|nr:ABC transporter ATP-binding protein [Clostridia bacterium]